MWEVNRKQPSALAIDQGLYRVLCSIKILITNQSNLIWPDKFSFAYLLFKSDVPERNYSSDFFYGHSTCPSAMFFFWGRPTCTFILPSSVVLGQNNRTQGVRAWYRHCRFPGRYLFSAPSGLERRFHDPSPSCCHRARTIMMDL